MKKFLIIVLILWATVPAVAQLKPRADAFPPVEEVLSPKAVTMASTVEEMAGWDRYPTYDTYLEMMQRWVDSFPTLCHVDTIGTSIQGRLILSMYIEVQTDDDLYRPEFFYSSTIHGDEVTGYVMMLRLIDTLLNSYGTSPEITSLINSTRISINPLANPDGTYWRGNHTVQGSQRYNANGTDLNRNFPNPFVTAKPSVPQENQAMMDYFATHQFRLSANLHGGAEVMNYPWDSFTSSQNPHPAADWQDIHFEPVGFDLLDEQFTIAELQRLYESILGVNFDRRNFYRKMLQTGVLEEVEEDKPQRVYFGDMKEMRVMPVDDLFGAVKESAPCPAPARGSSNAFILPLADEAEDGTTKATARIKRIHELLRSNPAKDEPCEITSAMMSNDDAAPERSRSVGRKGKLYRFNEEKYNRMKEDGNFRLEF